MTRKEFCHQLLLSNLLSKGQDYNRADKPTEPEVDAVKRRCTFIGRLADAVPIGFFDDEHPGAVSLGLDESAGPFCPPQSDATDPQVTLTQRVTGSIDPK